MPGHPLEPLCRLDGVDEAVARARSACEELRWHRALRRQWEVARREVGVRCAHEGARLDGVRVPLDLLRDVARGAAPVPDGPDGRAAWAALRVQAEVERLMPAPGAASGRVTLPFAQLLARLHVAVTAGPGGSGPELAGAVVGGASAAELYRAGDPVGGPGGAGSGRPRSGEQPQDLRGLGAAPTGPDLAGRMAGLAELIATPLPTHVPAVVLAAVVHGELLALRPFSHGNGPVARAFFRHQLTAAGIDPVGVVVPEARWAAEPTIYLSAAAGFAVGSTDGVAAWLRYCADSVVAGAEEGRAVADAVLAGRLGPEG